MLCSDLILAQLRALREVARDSWGVTLPGGGASEPPVVIDEGPLPSRERRDRFESVEWLGVGGRDRWREAGVRSLAPIVRPPSRRVTDST